MTETRGVTMGIQRLRQKEGEGEGEEKKKEEETNLGTILKIASAETGNSINNVLNDVRTNG